MLFVLVSLALAQDTGAKPVPLPAPTVKDIAADLAKAQAILDRAQKDLAAFREGQEAKLVGPVQPDAPTPKPIASLQPQPN